MEKRGRPRHLLILCLGLYLAMLLNLTAFPGEAWARSLAMQEVKIDARLLRDASMQVTEHLTIDFSGQWNGFYIRIPQGSTPIVEVAVQENDRPYTFNPAAQYGPPGTYLVKTEGDQVTIDWSISAQDEVRSFDVSYRVMNAVQVHSDVAELYRKFINDANGSDIDMVKVELVLPAGAQSYQPGEDIRIWGHGPLNGTVRFAGTDTVIMEVSDLPANTMVEGRVVMPPALFPNAPAAARTDRAALPSILAEEETWAQQANQQRTVSRWEMGGGVGSLAGTLAALLLLWLRFGRDHRVGFQGDYFRELPGQYSPAELGQLYHFQKNKPPDMTATILDLARRRFIYLEAARVQKPTLFGSKETDTYRLTLAVEPDQAAANQPEGGLLRAHEKELLDFLGTAMAENRGFLYLTDIESYTREHRREFYQFWQKWTEGLKQSGQQAGLFEDRGKMPRWTVLSGIGLFLLGFIVMFRSGVLGFALVLAGVLIATVPLFFRRRSVTGQEDYVRWKAFKRFLQDFSEMERHEIPSLIIWEHYLVYAVTLGVAQEVIKQLDIVFPSMQDGDYQFGYGWMSTTTPPSTATPYGSFASIGAFTDQALQSVQNAVSRSTSGSGSGGGFSGGGGGGGGGSSFGGR